MSDAAIETELKDSLKIAYISSVDPSDANQSSGVYFFQKKCMQKYIGDIDALGPVNTTAIGFLKNIFKFCFRFSRRRYNLLHSILISMWYGYIFSKILRRRKYDIVFGDKASNEMAYINTHVPIIYSTDATFDAIHNYYPEFTNLSRLSIWEGNLIEKKILNKASIIICSSDWSKDSVVYRYKIDPRKVFVLPRGANLIAGPEKSISPKKRPAVCNLLFVGKSWKRKGGDIAYDAYLELKRNGLNVHLTIIGAFPPINDPNVTIIPHLDKNNHNDYVKYTSILRETTFLILPSRAECSGIVFSESSAFGIPSIAADTGGVSTSIIHKKTGYLLPNGATGKEYAKIIEDLYFDWEKYTKLSTASRLYYEKSLNWDSWSKCLTSIIEDKICFKKKP
jgi:glycosyltransferase involved in cell wall biosynthesis